MDAEVKAICAIALTNGMQFKHKLDVLEVTADIWERVNKSERDMFATFNMFGNCSAIKITTDEVNAIMDISVREDSIDFYLTKEFESYSKEEKRVIPWAVFETVAAYSKISGTKKEGVDEPKE